MLLPPLKFGENAVSDKKRKSCPHWRKAVAPPLVEHWNTHHWSLVKMLPTNNLGRIGRQLILLDETLSEKLEKMKQFKTFKNLSVLYSIPLVSSKCLTSGGRPRNYYSRDSRRQGGRKGHRGVWATWRVV